MSKLRQTCVFALFAMAIVVLYLYKIDGVGVVGPDEPRYAAIGRTMAATGDLITPVLWGKPWFEKPPLLYWMTAFGTSLGLSHDLCGRLPVAALSLLFLAGVFVWTEREFGLQAAAVTTFGLATSAGWLTYSGLCLTDLPLAVSFAVAMAIACSLLHKRPPTSVHLRLSLLGACIGLGVLAKGLVPIVLALPLFWYLRAYIRAWWVAVLACVVVALPWYWLVYARNGFAFIDDFFIKHHLQRLYSATLLHVQPPYYYVPVLLAGLFPWTPLFALPILQRRPWDRRQQLLLVTAAVGFIFFSATRNKLPHYVLPILPLLFVLLGAQFQDRKIAALSRWWLLGPALLLATVPLIADILPPILAAGRLSRAAIERPTLAQSIVILLPIAACCFVPRRWLAIALASCAFAGMLFLKLTSYPAIDNLVSPREFWLANKSLVQHACNGGVNRDWLYGLSYYRGTDLPECQGGHFDYFLRTVSRGAPGIFPLH